MPTVAPPPRGGPGRLPRPAGHRSPGASVGRTPNPLASVGRTPNPAAPPDADRITVFDSGQAAAGQGLLAIWAAEAAQAGLDPAVLSGHSLRAGFVTNAVQRGASAASICAQTGHRSDEMMQRYVRAGRQFRDNANLKIW